MAEQENLSPAAPQEDPPEAVVYASPVKRIWAWVGVVYMVILVFLMTWMYAHGSFLTGITLFMLAPALGGGAATGLCLFLTKKALSPLHRAGLLLFALLFALLAVLALLWGVPQLLAAMGG